MKKLDPKIHVYRIQHPEPELLSDPAKLQVFGQALINQNADNYINMIKGMGGDSLLQHIFSGAKAQFHVLKDVLNGQTVLIPENSDLEDIKQTIQHLGSYIRNAFNSVPEKFHELTKLQRAILATLPLHYIVLAINPEKKVCPTLLGTQREIKNFLQQSEIIIRTNNKSIKKEIMRQMNIMHAVSVCLATRFGSNVDLVTGAMHDTNHLGCFFNTSYTQSFYPSRNDMVKAGVKFPKEKLFSSRKCKKDTSNFLKKWPSYQKLISYCLNNVTKNEAQEIEAEYKAQCYPIQNTESAPATQLVSAAFTGFSSAAIDEFAKSFDSTAKEWLTWCTLQLFFHLAYELFNENYSVATALEQATKSLILLGLVRFGINQLITAVNLLIEKTPKTVCNKLQPALNFTASLALPVYSTYSNGLATVVGLFSGYCGRKCIQHFTSEQNHHSVKVH